MTARADAPWTAILPEGTVWLPLRRRVMAAVLRGELGGAAGHGRPEGIRAYLMVPSHHRPVIVARWDAGVLRYLAGAVLSVPPGAGPLLSRVLTAALPLLRHPLTWIVGAAFYRGGIVLVGEDP